MRAFKFLFEFLCSMLMAASFLTAIVCCFLFLFTGNLTLLWGSIGGGGAFLFLMFLGEALKFPGTEHLH